MTEQTPDTVTTATDTATEAPETVKAFRRQPCPCGSGKKFKNCHEGKAGYEVATEDTPDVTTAPLVADEAQGKHFPGKESKNIASQRAFRAYFFKRG